MVMVRESLLVEMMLHDGWVSRSRISERVDRLNASFGLVLGFLYCLYFSLFIDDGLANPRHELNVSWLSFC